MGLIRCPDCKRGVSDSAGSCPKCGCEFTPEKIAEIQQKKKKAQKGCGIGCLSILLLFAFIITIGECSSPDTSKTTSSSSAQWYKNGSLHNATFDEWKRATSENRLATVADWLASTNWKGHLKSSSDFEKLKIKAQILVNAVDEVGTAEGTESLQVNEIAATIITMTNDLGPETPSVRGGVGFADDEGAYGGYCSDYARELVEGLAKSHADSGGGTKLIIGQGGESLLFVIPIQQERENLISMFLAGEEATWHKAVQAMYDSCIRLVYIVDPATGVEEAVGFELSKLTYVTE